MLAFSGAIALALIHIFAAQFRFLDQVPKTRWISFAGGLSVAYVFLHLLPELEHLNLNLQLIAGNNLSELFVWLASLIGLATYYGLTKLASRRDQSHDDHIGGFILHLGSYAFYNILIGSLVDEQATGYGSFLLYLLAMGFHFLVNDRHLRRHYPGPYHQYGRWILSGCIVLGYLLTASIEIPEYLTASSIAFLSGSVILNVFREELPESNSSSFIFFLLGLSLYSGLLLTLAYFGHH